jgi:hypothetical protein
VKKDGPEEFEAQKLLSDPFLFLKGSSTDWSKI